MDGLQKRNTNHISPKNQNFLDSISKKIDKQRKQKKAKK